MGTHRAWGGDAEGRRLALRPRRAGATLSPPLARAGPQDARRLAPS